ncbi:hypothetical protein EDC04DRAFT_2746439 [Pisolithus marmoratus]|nr:hypothetical protein EDC04DRAFT_2746439 [Pisolithus marmoratus]
MTFFFCFLVQQGASGAVTVWHELQLSMKLMSCDVCAFEDESVNYSDILPPLSFVSGLMDHLSGINARRCAHKSQSTKDLLHNIILGFVIKTVGHQYDQ